MLQVIPESGRRHDERYPTTSITIMRIDHPGRVVADTAGVDTNWGCAAEPGVVVAGQPPPAVG